MSEYVTTGDIARESGRPLSQITYALQRLGIVEDGRARIDYSDVNGCRTCWRRSVRSGGDHWLGPLGGCRSERAKKRARLRLEPGGEHGQNYTNQFYPPARGLQVA